MTDKDADLWREVEKLRALVDDLCRFRDVVFNDLYLRVRSLEDRLPPQRPAEAVRPAPAPPSLAQLALDEVSEAQKRFVFHAEAAGPPPTSLPAASPLAPPEVENLCADAHDREEVLVALVRRAAEEIRDRAVKKNLLADLEALLAEKD